MPGPLRAQLAWSWSATPKTTAAIASVPEMRMFMAILSSLLRRWYGVLPTSDRTNRVRCPAICERPRPDRYGDGR
jgi:hypothetical protein